MNSRVIVYPGRRIMNSSDEIIPGLWMGDITSPDDAEEGELELIVNLAQVRDVGKVNQYTRWEIDDGPLLPDMDQMQMVVQRVLDAWGKGGKVLIHCNAGVNRSGLLTTLVVREIAHVSGREALDWVRSQRSEGPFPAIVCNPTFEDYVLRQVTPGTEYSIDVGDAPA